MSNTETTKKPSTKALRMTSLIVFTAFAIVFLVWQFSDEGKLVGKGNEEHKHKHTNGLINETSPYLLQHAHNPVNWMPWSDEAFAKAKAENKPIFLSLGYSTCHWCHVMAHQSFEDEDVAEILNKHFICIKVDREELPDVDEQYMLATQVFYMMQGNPRGGGWPNSVWLTADRKPWYAGTYFPKAQFMTISNRLAEIWKTQRKAVDQQANTMAELMQRHAGAELAGNEELSPAIFNEGVKALLANYDETNGGFGRAPKFPPHGTLALLSRHYETNKKLSELEIISHTLDSMRHGGVWDHVGGGFHRYATDAKWFLPHFEKMLYDNAQLMRAYTDGHRLTNEADYKRVVAEIYTWLGREMTDKSGGFYSALDADSLIAHGSHEKEEGKFYVWTPKQVKEAVGEEDGALFVKIYGLTEDGNFEDESTRRKTGDSIPFLGSYLSDVADDMKIEEAVLRKRIDGIRAKLLAVRAKRPRPGLDDKVLTAWNGLMIGSLAYAGHHFKEPSYLASAVKAADFVLKNMRDKKGGLLRTWRNGKAKLPAYLNDYAFMAQATLQLHQATDDKRWLTETQSLMDFLIEHFSDEKNGGFYATSSAHDKLVIRSKGNGGGGNIPSGNGVAARVLTELAVLTEQAEKKKLYAEHAAKNLEAHAAMMWRRPFHTEDMILALERFYSLVKEKKLPALGPTESDKGNADAVAREEPLKMELFVSHDQAKPGSTIHAVVRIRVRKPYHIYAHKPGNDIVIPTDVQLDAKGASFGTVQYPKGHTVFDKAVDAKVVLHEGTIEILAPIKIDADAKGPIQLTFKVKAQACDDKTCLLPTSKALTFTIQVAADAQGKPRHVDVFKAHATKP